MPRELITIQVGQCGNQIGCRFWDLAVKEHMLHNPLGTYDEALSSFFKNVDSKSEPPAILECGNGKQPVATLKARAIVVDMEEGVVNSILRVSSPSMHARVHGGIICWKYGQFIASWLHQQSNGNSFTFDNMQSSLGSLFDARSLLVDSSGAGNNWAHGHHFYGPQYRDHVLQLVRKEAEQCDSLQGFLLTHSLGGGTGSGFGTYLIALLEDLYPDIFRISASLFPSEDDDVVTSPYNSVLSLSELVDHCDAVLPMENQALHDIVAAVDRQTHRTSSRTAATVDLLGKEKKPYDRMNNIAASVILNMTSGMRFPGMLNVDMNDITMNMVPFPKHHFLIPALSPLVVNRGMPTTSQKMIDRIFCDVFSRENQLLKCNPRGSTYLACGLLARGHISNSDITRNLANLQPNMKMAYWNQEGFKIGLCNQAPAEASQSLLCLANNCCVASTFDAMLQRFEMLFNRRVYAHHYTQYMEMDDMANARMNVIEVARSYQALDTQAPPQDLDDYGPEGLTINCNLNN